MCAVFVIVLQLNSEEDECVDVESDDVNSLLSIFDEFTAELLKEGEIVICTEVHTYQV